MRDAIKNFLWDFYFLFVNANTSGYKKQIPSSIYNIHICKYNRNKISRIGDETIYTQSVMISLISFV